MGLKVCVLSSGSSGNSIAVLGGSTPLIIDMGIPPTRAEKNLRSLGVEHSGLPVLITHEHSDHISGLSGFIRRNGGEVYCSFATYAALKGKVAETSLKPFCGDFYIGDITVSPFTLSHDVPCVGYNIYRAGQKISVATDFGIMTDGVMAELKGSDLVVIESNHDVDMVMNNRRYPPILKRRILSEKGHLSNVACAKSAAELVKSGVKQIILAHLSRENNYPELAFGTCADALNQTGIKEGRDVMLDVATDSMGKITEVL